MIEEVYKNIFRIGNPLPNNPLKELNAYLIKGKDKSLLIDTGFNREECRETLLGALDELEVDLTKLDLFITHLHADHSGLAGLFTETSEKIYTSEIDGIFMNSIPKGVFKEGSEERIRMLDLEQYSLQFKDLPGNAYSYREEINFTYLVEGDMIEIGDYQLKVIETAGHTPGMITLYEPNHKLYFSADHILDRISPNITFWNFEFDALDAYITNLTKVFDLDVYLIFPSHRNVMDDHPRRAKELVEHHHERIEEVFNIVSDNPQSSQTIASQMSWRIRANSWEEFPIVQKFFATGEAMAHLEYLFNQNRIKREIQDGIVYYFR